MGDRIRKYRERKGFTQNELAKLLGFESTSIISMWETGERSPRSEILPLLAIALGCTIDDLFNDDTTNTRPAANQ